LLSVINPKPHQITNIIISYFTSSRVLQFLIDDDGCNWTVDIHALIEIAHWHDRYKTMKSTEI